MNWLKKAISISKSLKISIPDLNEKLSRLKELNYEMLLGVALRLPPFHSILLKFIYFEKATKFCEISTLTGTT
jgi:hypothetical protein